MLTAVHMQVLASDKPLISYGLGRGSMLELEPIEPAVPRALPWGSPPLSSPEHRLVHARLAVMLRPSGWFVQRSPHARAVAWLGSWLKQKSD